MSILGQWFNQAWELWRDKRDEALHWRLNRQDDVANLQRSKALSEMALLAQLKKQEQQLAHELAVAEARNSNELAMIKVQCKQDLKDYQQYLQSLDKLKQSLRASYVHLPEAVAFTIHHHAKLLLNRMWDEQDAQEKLKIEMQLIQFMTAVHEDSLLSLENDGRESLPQKTLAFIDGDA
ncbi:hypothetical protein IVG45_14255 [Methylomonas sp. LL1]|uniref:hypothetical protein n=1 Tax=Methylomonas sp. LL1 TaxID=2785785 RepID=UPI0018C42B70|nr:hypothetical protein [Methylomonas sp. LL1]QPK62016.1 hypothetical protein IVG45_14255 [Methylomonas sp. LL1]